MEIDVKGGERDHIKAYHLEREITSEKEREILQGERDLQGERILKEKVFLKDPRCLVFKRRDATCLLEGKDMFICAYLH